MRAVVPKQEKAGIPYRGHAFEAGRAVRFTRGAQSRKGPNTGRLSPGPRYGEGPPLLHERHWASTSFAPLRRQRRAVAEGRAII